MKSLILIKKKLQLVDYVNATNDKRNQSHYV